MIIGSVQFFKRLILAVIVTMFLVLSLLVWRFYCRAERLKQQLSLADELWDVALGQVGDVGFGGDTVDVSLKDRLFGRVPEYQKLYPDFYAPAKADPKKVEKDVVYLTFDDGPSACTERVLEVLDKENVKATFFVIGTTNSENLRVMRETARRGHTIGMHSYSHNYSYIYGSVEHFLADMHNIFALIKQTTGIVPTIFRFPGGSICTVNRRIHDEIMAEMLRRGFVPYDWTVSADDAIGSTSNVSDIVNNVVERVSKGANAEFVLMHDSRRRWYTVDALPALIRQCRAKGLKFDKITADVKPVLFNSQYERGK